MSDTPNQHPTRRKGARNGYGNGSFYVNTAKRRVELTFPLDGRRERVRASLVGRTEAEAKAECRRKRDARIAEAAANVDLTPGSVDEVIEQWLRHRVPPGSQRVARSLVTHHIGPALGATPAAKLSARDVEAFLVGRAATGLAPSMVSKLRSTLHGICRLGVDWDYMPANPVAKLGKLVLPETAGTTKPHRWYGAREYAVACAWLADGENIDTDAALVAVMLFAGLRSGEARAMRWSAVDWQRGLLRVVEAVKADRSVGVTKTRAGTRVVPMAPELLAVLRRHAANQLAEGRTELVFTKAGEMLTHDQVTGAAERFATQTGLDYVNPHGFRHTFASIALHHGCTYPKLARLMGHADVSQLIRTYGHEVEDSDTVDMAAFVGAGAARRAG